MVVVVDASTPEEKPARRRFVTMPSELHRLLTWLREQGVEEAVMDSTAQYCRSVWLELEPHMHLHLAEAFSNRAPRGRKHDFKDAEQLVRRLIADEMILSFVPSATKVSVISHLGRFQPKCSGFPTLTEMIKPFTVSTIAIPNGFAGRAKRAVST
jgi:hypothetical protein